MSAFQVLSIAGDDRKIIVRVGPQKVGGVHAFTIDCRAHYWGFCLEAYLNAAGAVGWKIATGGEDHIILENSNGAAEVKGTRIKIPGCVICEGMK